ncbi:MAG: inositol monophosphatase [Clostridia bacterium]|nr:inositol monophosphatase [Clostridia bacterium]
MEQQYKDILDLMRKCGEIIKNADRESIAIDEKTGRANFVTEYDRMVQDKLNQGLSEIVNDALFVGEEGETNTFSSKGKYFIVDPIDGTTNFIKDYHMSCISVALMKDGEAVFGAIYNPYLDEMFYAMKGEGAFCNEKKIHVSSEPLSNGLVLFGSSPYKAELSKKSFEVAYDFFTKALDIRRSGSAALDLCAVAAGRAELYFELNLQPWDYAAGSLILTEAGGVITDFEGNELVFDRPCSVLARNGVTEV